VAWAVSLACSPPRSARAGEVREPRLLVVVAHPDDETFGCGSVLLAAAAAGAVTTVCCASRGEAGDPAPGCEVPDGGIGVLRERELHAAASQLEVDEVILLDLHDSGMDGPAAPGTVIATPVDGLAARIAQVIARVRPDVIVTLDGSDGHRDHLHVRDAVQLAVEADPDGPVQRLFLQGLPRSLLRRWADHMRVRNPASPYLDVDARGLGTPDETITTVLDARDHLDQRRAAIACHASQTSPFSDLPADLEEAFLATDHLRQVWPAAPSGDVGADLFAGLDLSDTAAGASTGSRPGSALR